MQYYCYVFYDEDWQATYVGKGQGGRVYKAQDHPEVPPKERIQLFHFEQEWAAYECEIELIAFWGRRCDGGCLFNRSTGGKSGSRGIDRKGKKHNWYGKKHTEATRRKMSQAAMGNKRCVGRQVSEETRAKMRAAWVIRKQKKQQEAS